VRRQGSFFLDPAQPSGSATFSDCGRYRYTLTREWGEGKTVCFIGLNPSTADAEEDDPTIRRCIGFAKREGGGSLLMLNLFALRSTDPAALLTTPNPVGEPAEEVGVRAAGADLIICAWGALPKVLRWRAAEIADGFCGDRQLLCLGKTMNGSPRHPLYLRADAPLVEWP
jgi:hypothetical protein